MGVEAESKSRGLATTVKTLAHILVSFIEFKLEKMSLNLSYTMLNGETNCFQASSYVVSTTQGNTGSQKSRHETFVFFLG